MQNAIFVGGNILFGFVAVDFISTALFNKKNNTVSFKILKRIIVYYDLKKNRYITNCINLVWRRQKKVEHHVTKIGMKSISICEFIS